MARKKATAETPSARPSPALPERAKGKNGFVKIVVVIALIAAAFGGGWLWGEIRLRQASASWGAERTKMKATVTETTQALSDLTSVRKLWEIDGRISEILADLADNNFGLARDTATEARRTLESLTPSLPAGMATALAPLAGILKTVQDDAALLSLDAKSRARDARALIRVALSVAATPASTPSSSEKAEPGGP
jgi:anti-sigma factor RsiW